MWSMGALVRGHWVYFAQACVCLGVYAVHVIPHHAIGLQTDCMVIVLAPVVEAAGLPRVCPFALGYGLPSL